MCMCVYARALDAHTSLCSEEGVGSLKLQAVMRCWELNLGPPIGDISALTYAELFLQTSIFLSDAEPL